MGSAVVFEGGDAGGQTPANNGADGTSKVSSIVLLLAPQPGARRVGKWVPVVPSIRFADGVHRPAHFFHASGMLTVQSTVSWPRYLIEAWPMPLLLRIAK